MINKTFTVTKKNITSLGILRIDYDYEPALGDIDHHGSYNYPVYYRVVPGLTFEVCQKGIWTDEIKTRLERAIKFLEEEKGVSAITADCGFMMWYQPYLREMTRKPVFLSALTQIPSVLSFFGSKKQIMIMTANGQSLEPMRQLIRDEAGVDTEKPQFVIVGCENTETFGPAVAQGLKVPVENCIPEIVAVAKEALKKHKLVGAIVLECTELPPYANSIRYATGLPVYDSITNANFGMAGVSKSRNFGINYMLSFDGRQESYGYGKNLSDEEKDELEFKKG